MNRKPFPQAMGRCGVLLLFLSLVGCFGGPGVPVSAVSGVVTQAGQPISGATVTFYPETGRPSVGMTDETGRYELQFTQDVNGAMIGMHRVSISYGGPPPPGESGSNSGGGTKRSRRILPPTNVDWPDRVEVTDSANTIDFDL